MTVDKKVIDWEAIELKYRAGVLTLRDIASEHGITHGAINKRAARDGWSRDLGAKIRAKAEEIVSKAAVSNSVTKEQRSSQQAVIDANAEVIVQRVMAHRSSLTNAHRVYEKQLQELELMGDNVEAMQKFGEMMYNPDEKGQDKRLEAYLRTISFGSRVTAFKTLTDALKSLVPLEREVFGIVDRHSTGNTLEAALDFVKAAG